MIKLNKATALVVLLGTFAVPLQAISLSGMKKKAKAGWKKAKGVLESKNVRKAAAVAAGVVAAAAGAAMLYQHNKRMSDLENLDTASMINLKTVLDKIDNFATDMRAAMKDRIVNAKFIGVDPADLTRSSFDKLVDQVLDLASQHTKIFESKIMNPISANRGSYDNSIIAEANQLAQKLNELNSFMQKGVVREVLLDELAPGILGLRKGASQGEIKKAHDQMTKKWKPKKRWWGKGKKEVSEEEAQDKLAIIDEAYAHLMKA